MADRTAGDGDPAEAPPSDGVRASNSAEPASPSAVRASKSAEPASPSAVRASKSAESASNSPASTPRLHEKKRRLRWRPWLRAIHRDAGYLAVGLTFVYALSGIAVNHIKDWTDGDPSFKTYSRTVAIDALQGDDAAIAESLRKRFEIREAPREIYRATPTQLEVIFDKRSLHVDTEKGTVVDEGQEPRFILRVANWLHLNRGKAAWTYVADAYAGGLLFLATSGIFMIAGKKGLFGRGAILVALGVLIPVLYVHFAGP